MQKYFASTNGWRSNLQARVDVIEKAGIWGVGDDRLICMGG